MTQFPDSPISIAQLFEMAVVKQKNMSKLSRLSGISRATLYRIMKGDSEKDISFETYGKLARFVLEGK